MYPGLTDLQSRPQHQSSGRARFLHALSFSFIIFFFLDVDRPPAVDAVDAAGDHVVQVGPCRGGPRAVDLRGGVVEALFRLLLAAHAGGGGRGQVDVAVVRLVHLGLVGEQDLGLRAAAGHGGGGWPNGRKAKKTKDHLIESQANGRSENRM